MPHKHDHLHDENRCSRLFRIQEWPYTRRCRNVPTMTGVRVQVGEMEFEEHNLCDLCLAFLDDHGLIAHQDGA